MYNMININLYYKEKNLINLKKTYYILIIYYFNFFMILKLYWHLGSEYI